MTSTAELAWFGCSTFRLAIGDVVVFLDAYLDRVSTAAPVGLTTDQVDRADWILIGHSHFDHLYGAHRIALNTGATIVGSYETARVMAAMGVPDRQLVRVAGGERVRLDNDVSVRVLPALHSCVWTHRAAPGVAEVCCGHEGVSHQDQQDAMAGVIEWVSTLGPEVREHLMQTATDALGDGGTLTYLLDSAAGRILFQDSAGAWSDVLAGLGVPIDLAILAAAGRPNHDGEPWQGSLLDYLAMEVAHLQPAAVALCHHDDFLPGFSQAVDVSVVERHLAATAPETALLPMEYGREYPVPVQRRGVHKPYLGR